MELYPVPNSTTSHGLRSLLFAQTRSNGPTGSAWQILMLIPICSYL
jgi:hypothetical protein